MLKTALVVLTIIYASQITATEIAVSKAGFSGQNVTQKMGYIIDQSGELDIEGAIEKFKKQEFAPLSERKSNFGLTQDVFWGVLKIRSEEDYPLELVISQIYPNSDKIEFWILDNDFNQENYGRGGDLSDFQENVLRHRLAVFKTEVKPGTNFLVVRVETRGLLKINLRVDRPFSFFAWSNAEYLTAFSLSAILIAMCFYNFCIWLQTRKTTYILYIAFIMTVVLHPITILGFGKHLITDFSFLQNQMYPITGGLSSVAAAFFGYYFLSLNQQKRLIRYICLAPVYFGVITIVLTLYKIEMGILFGVLNGLVVSLSCLTTGLYLSFQRFRPAYFYTLAWFLIILANIFKMAAVAGIIKEGLLSEWGILTGAALEAVLISLGLADKIRISERNSMNRIKGLNQDLKSEKDKVEDLNSQLESLLAGKVREVTTILSEIPIGILVIDQIGLKVSENHSLFVKELFKTEAIANSSIDSILFKNSTLEEETKEQILTILESSLFMDNVNFTTNEHLLPQEIHYIFGSHTYIYSITWQAVIDDSDMVEKILITVKDVTHLQELETRVRSKNHELQLISEIIGVPWQRFNSFIESCKNLTEESLLAVEKCAATAIKDIELVLMNLHTVKGMARSLHLSSFTPIVHDLETYISSQAAVWLEPHFQKDLKQKLFDVEQHLIYYQKLNESLVRRVNKEPNLPDLHKLDHAICEFTSLLPYIDYDARSKAMEIIHELTEKSCISFSEVLREIAQDLKGLATQLKKTVPKINIPDQDLHLTAKGEELFRTSFVHILSNALSHGIESDEIRKQKGKEVRGNINLELSFDAEHLLIVVYDDGAGIDLDQVRTVAQEKGFLESDQTATHSEIANLIFHSGLTTKDEITDIAGRGVGMGAIREQFEKYGASVEIELRSRISDSNRYAFVLKLKVPAYLFVDYYPSHINSSKAS